MADFLLIYEGGDSEWMKNSSPEQIQAAMQEWGAWFKELEASGNLRNPGAALAPGGAVLTRNGAGIKTDTALSEVKELIGGYSVIHAETLAEATELAKGSPFLRNNPGGNILVRPILEMEG
jgi:hypothetical protein